MKITIDTKEDSHQDIRKVIKMLQHLIGEPSATNQPDIFEPNSFNPGSEPAEAFVNMFSDAPKEAPVKEPKKTFKENFEDIPEVIPYK
jgi:hypothetical protein